MSASKRQHLILGGVIKAATSSLFTYLGAHPQVCGSRVKETLFFSTQYSGDPGLDATRYAAYFSPADEHRVLFEASPEYLTYRENVAPRIRRQLPEARLLFVLRNPVDRLYSHFNFARGKLELPGDLSFERFVEYCEQFNQGKTTPEESGIALKHLRALEMGKYAGFLANFYSEFEAERIKVIFYDDFAANPLENLAEICAFVGISPEFFENLALDRSNVTFTSRNKVFHRIAMYFNRLLEPQLRRYPSLKRGLVGFYKIFNQDRQGFAAMREATRNKLDDYYAPGNAELKTMLGGQKLPAWIA